MGAYADLDSLIALQFKTGGFGLKHNQSVSSLLFGRRASHVRGRGLDFEELRGYVAGDDVRTIDWRVTARMQKPYVRTYSEERDRPTMLVVDQRINMFFGSRTSMKSVVATEIAALATWQVFHQGDRIGSLIFNDDTTASVRMRRSMATVLYILDRIVYQNRLLRVDTPTPSRPERLNQVLDSVARVCHHDALIVIASDFDGADEETRHRLLNLSRSNDVICCLVHDPLAMRIPAAEQLVASDGKLQVQLELGQRKIREMILDASDRRMRSILSWERELGIPVLLVNTAEDVALQLRGLLGKIAARRRRI